MAGMNRTFGYAVDRVPATATVAAHQVLAPGATIDVYALGTLNHVQLFADASGVTPLANPFAANGATAYYDFYAQPQRLDVRFSGTGITTPYTLGDVQPQPAIPESAIFDVRSYGAVGDGITDDRVAVQAAITAAIAYTGATANGNAIVYLSPGQYRIIGALSALGADRVQFIGDSRETSQLVFDDTATTGLTIDSLTAANTSSVLTSDVAIGDRVVNVTSSAGMHVGDLCFLQDNYSNDGTFITFIAAINVNAITLEGASPVSMTVARVATLFTAYVNPFPTGVRVERIGFRCSAGVNTVNKLTLLFLSRCIAPVVDECGFDGSTGPLITTRQMLNGEIHRSIFAHALTVAGTGIEVQTSTGTGIYDNRFRFCQFGFTVSNSPYSIMAGNRVGGRATSVALGRGIRVGFSSHFSSVVNNVITDPNLFGIYFQDASYCTCTGNVVAWTGDFNTNVQQHGIVVGGFETAYCVWNTIADNVVRGASGRGIFVQSNVVATPLYCTIQGNIVTACLQGGILMGSNQNSCVGNSVSGGDTNFSLIGVTAVAGSNLIVGNTTHKLGANDVTSIATSGSGGLNTIGPNIYDSTPLYNATDLITTTIAYVDSQVALVKQHLPWATRTEFDSPADIAFHTAWTFTIDANLLSTNGVTGFHFSASLNAFNTGGTIKLTIGATSIFNGTPAIGSVTVDGYVVRFSSTVLTGYFRILDTTTGVLRLANVAYTVDTTLPIVVTLGIANIAATAGDIKFFSGVATPFGIPQSAYA